MTTNEARIPANLVYDLGGVAVDQVADNAIKGGFSHEVRLDPWDSQNPIPMGAPMPGTPDLLGVKFGRFTVIGHTGKKAGKHGAKWVVRCSCGTYSVRVTKSIRNPANSSDACGRCRHVAQIKRAYEYRSTGKDKSIWSYL